MNIIAFGLNHKTATIALREKFSLSRQEIEKFLGVCKAQLSPQEIVILSTCNRTEIYAYGGISELENFFHDYACHDKKISLATLLKHSYRLTEQEAVIHLMRVACGLDSLILGEPEILGQLKSAFSLACLHKTVGPNLSRLFRQTFHVAKRIRTHTHIGACPVSVASTAILYAKEWLHDKLRRPPKILVIGTGQIGRLVVKHAKTLSSEPLLLMSQHLENAQRLAREERAIAVNFSQLSVTLPQVDMVISATASKNNIIFSSMTKAIEQDLLMIDLAVPRDIEPHVTKNPYIHLCQLDQLKKTIQNHVHMRSHAAHQAEILIEEAACDFLLSLRTLDSEEIIKSYRAHMEEYCEHELKKILKKNHQEEEQLAAILKSFSHNLLNKIMHLPSTQLRQASLEGRNDMLQAASEIFGLSEKTSL